MFTFRGKPITTHRFRNASILPDNSLDNKHPHPYYLPNVPRLARPAASQTSRLSLPSAKFDPDFRQTRFNFW